MTVSPKKIAVLMPVFNPGPELIDTLASISAQTVPATLFLVDDGSKNRPDYTAITRGLDTRVIALPQNVGITGALNAGLEAILGGDFDFVARVDNGDINLPERFATQVAYLEAHPDLSLVSAHVRYEYVLTGLKIDWKGHSDPRDCLRELRYNAPLTHAAIMFRMAFLKQMQAYPTNYPAAEDYAMEFWAARNNHLFANVPKMLYRTIEMQESISGRLRRRQLQSRLRLQLDNADWRNPHTYLGLARTAALLGIPVSPLRRLRRAIVK